MIQYGYYILSAHDTYGVRLIMVCLAKRGTLDNLRFPFGQSGNQVECTPRQFNIGYPLAQSIAQSRSIPLGRSMCLHPLFENPECKTMQTLSFLKAQSANHSELELLNQRMPKPILCLACCAPRKCKPHAKLLASRKLGGLAQSMFT